jgi:hypothetical protein
MNAASTPRQRCESARNTSWENAIMAMKVTQSASPTTPLCFLMGQNSRGDWTVRDRSGKRGGLFVSLAHAQRYVRLESIGRATNVIMVSGQLELEGASA